MQHHDDRRRHRNVQRALRSGQEPATESGGHRFGIEGELNSRLPTLFQQLPWSEQQQADWLFKHLLEKALDYL